MRLVSSLGTHKWRPEYVLPLWCLVAVAQVSAVGQIETHEPIVWPHDGLVSLQVCWATAQALYVDTPLLRIQAESLESTLLAEELDGIDVLVATVVAGTGVTLRVLVGHGRAERIENGAGGNVLGGDEEDGFTLALDFLLLWPLLVTNCSALSKRSYHDLSNLLVGFHQGLLHEL